MLLAVQQPCPLRRLVLNDVGPFVSKESVALIREYVGTDPDFADVKEFEAYLRWIWSPFGALTDDQWRHLAETSSRVTDSGRVTSAYDPDISKADCCGARRGRRPLARLEHDRRADTRPAWC